MVVVVVVGTNAGHGNGRGVNGIRRRARLVDGRTGGGRSMRLDCLPIRYPPRWLWKGHFASWKDRLASREEHASARRGDAV